MEVPAKARSFIPTVPISPSMGINPKTSPLTAESRVRKLGVLVYKRRSLAFARPS
jgi:hypothetical protein